MFELILRKKKIIFTSGVIVFSLFLIFGIFGADRFVSLDKNNLTQTLERTKLRDVIYIDLNGYSSLKKIVDIAHFPYWFKESKLEVINLYLDPEDIVKMGSKLPENKFVDYLLDENKVFVSGALNYGDVIAGHVHYYEPGNFSLFFNKATGKLEPMLGDISRGRWDEKTNKIEEVYELFDPITRRILAIPKFYEDNDDDMINVKYAKAEITDSGFFNSFGDAIDLDASDGFLVSGNVFADIGEDVIGGDAIDVSTSRGIIRDNTVTRCEDKGISVGEKSFPMIENNIIIECDMGIAVKDRSEAVIIGNTIKNNRQGIAIYQKKDVFGGGFASIASNIFEGNMEKIFTDEKSGYTKSYDK